MLNFVLNDFNNLPDYIQKDITELQSVGLISVDNQIDFDYFKNNYSIKPKI